MSATLAQPYTSIAIYYYFYTWGSQGFYAVQVITVTVGFTFHGLSHIHQGQGQNAIPTFTAVFHRSIVPRISLYL